MKTHTVNISTAFEAAWGKTKKHLWFLMVVTLLYGIVVALFKDSFILKQVFGALAIVSLSTVMLAIAHDKQPRYKDLTKHFASYKKPVDMLVMWILVSIFTFLGFMLLVLPGIYIAVRLMFFPYYVIEHEHKTVYESLSEIFAITSGNFWNLFLFVVLAIAVNVLGALALGVGLLVTFPLTVLAGTYIYKQLTPHYKRYH